MNTLTKSKHYKAVCGAVFAFLVCAGSFVPTPVYADGDLWGLVQAGLLASPSVQALKESVVTRYTSLEPGELSMLEYEIGAIGAVGTYVMAQDFLTSQGVQYNGISGSYVVSGLAKYTDSNNTTSVCTGTIIGNSNTGVVFNSDAGGIGFIPISIDGADWGLSVNSYTLSFQRDSSGGADSIIGLTTSGIVDIHNGITTILSNDSNPTYALSGTGSTWQGVQLVNNNYSITWGNNYSFFFKYSNPTCVLAYCTNFTFDDVSDPIDLYNQAYNKALENYPEYIDNWVDLEDEFAGSEPSQFDSLEFPPYIPQVDFHDVELPSETLPTGLTDGAGFWFSAFSNMVDSFGLKPYVILFLGLILLCVMLKL